MSATIHRLPVRPCLRAIGADAALPTTTRDYYGREMLAIAENLQEAAKHISRSATAYNRDQALRRGSDALEASLFHALTVLGCAHDDIDIRRLLAAREADRARHHE